jgi:hypothetical protein
VTVAKQTTGRHGHLARRWLRRLLLLLILTQLFLPASSVLPDTQFDMQLAPFLDGRRFDWVAWEINALWQEGEWWLHGQPLSGDPGSQKAEVLGFLARQQQIAQVEARVSAQGTELSRSAETSPPAPLRKQGTTAAAATQSELVALSQQQAEATAQVERIVAAQVAGALAAQGFGDGKSVWPPVTFRFDDMPAYLIISPRPEIRLYRGIHLLPDTSDSERTHTEAVIETKLDVSALVDDLGGIGSWPTMVVRTESLSDLLDIVAHEWAHTYLFFQPLGMEYDASRDLTTMNETVASIVGEEVAEAVIADKYPEAVAQVPEASGRGASSAQPDKFNLTMRGIRVKVDDLLAAGRISEAERYMETARQELAAEGYTLRRLNQAYFAFHGSYATSPASVDPIGKWMRQLRARSGSLRGFLEQVAQMRSLDDLLRALGENKDDPEQFSKLRDT